MARCISIEKLSSSLVERTNVRSIASPTKSKSLPLQTGWVNIHDLRCRRVKVCANLENERRSQPSDVEAEPLVSDPTSQKSKTSGITKETIALSAAPLPLFLLADAPAVREALEGFAEIIRSWDLPDWLIHWGHPGNMAVVLFAMGGYGSYLGWQIRLASDGDVIAKAKDMHPKLLGGMFFFFALGATGGVTSLVTSNRPIFESPHFITGVIGLTLLTIQSILSANFSGKPELRSVHAYLGSGTMALFFLHAFFGLQFGLSF